MEVWWLRDFPWIDAVCFRDLEGVNAWRSIDGGLGRIYGYGEPPEGATALTTLQMVEGASKGETATHHYAVETDVEPVDEAQLNAWYSQEHLPGLARVPGAINARRFVRQSGSPRYIACYDLTAPSTLDRPEWLAVRHTDWSSRVRPTFRNTRRTMFARATLEDL